MCAIDLNLISESTLFLLKACPKSEDVENIARDSSAVNVEKVWGLLWSALAFSTLLPAAADLV